MRRALISVTALLTLAACSGGGSTEPNPDALQGMWRMTAINGAPPPWSIPGFDPSTPVYVIGGDLGFAGDASGEGAIVLCTRVHHPAGTQVVTNYDRMTFTRTGSSVTLRFADDPTRQAESATLAAGRLQVQAERESGRPVYTFTKVSERPRQLSECAP